MKDLTVKKKVLRVAENMFMKYGIRSVSMDDLSRSLSMSKKTLYQFVKDKEELVMLVVGRLLEKQKKTFKKIAKTAANAIEELACVSLVMRKELELINPSMLFDIEKYHPHAWELWTTFKVEFIRKSIIRNLKDGIKGGYFREDINTEIIATMRILCIEAGCNSEIFSTRKHSLSEIHKQLFDHFVLGLCSDKGRELYLLLQENINLEYDK